jgi:NADP-dependent 3-hydroxy acid dehydrogenase YdfG
VSDAPLAGALALVTGASRGIGQAVAERLGSAGAHVVRLARSLGDRSGERRTDLRCDVTDPAQVERVVARVLAELGVPSILVNNAGVFFVKRIEETEPAEFTHAIAVNLTGTFLVVRALLPHLLRRGTGHVVTIGSISDHVAFSDSSAYVASKYGVRGLHEALAVEVARTGIRTTLVSPGPVDTPLWDPVDPDARAGFTKRQDMLCASDVADAVLFAVTQPQRLTITELRLMPTVYTPRR